MREGGMGTHYLFSAVLPETNTFSQLVTTT